MSEKFNDYTIKREITRQVREHEVFISFNSDIQAEAFQDWLVYEGAKLFGEWAEQNVETYED